MDAKTEFIGVWITPDIKDQIEKRANQKGMKIGEYLRGLVDKDLEK
jgi:hypothetical protein